MGILKITVNAGPVRFAVDWEGDADDIEDVMTFIDNMAADNNIPPEQLTHSTLARLPETGIMEEPGAQQVQVMAILYVVLNSPLNRPGAICQYAADEEITAVVTVSEDRVYIDLEGRTSLIRH